MLLRDKTEVKWENWGVCDKIETSLNLNDVVDCGGVEPSVGITREEGLRVTQSEEFILSDNSARSMIPSTGEELFQMQLPQNQSIICKLDASKKTLDCSGIQAYNGWLSRAVDGQWGDKRRQSKRMLQFLEKYALFVSSKSYTVRRLN